jgi:hypothetical protein
MTDFIENLSKQRVALLVNGPLRPLLLKLSDDICLELVEYWTRATMLFSHIQTHMSTLCWSRPYKIVGTNYNEDYMTLYRSQHDLDGAEEGKPVSLIMTPCIYIAGDESGGNHRARRRLLDATVIVSEKGNVPVVDNLSKANPADSKDWNKEEEQDEEL